LADASTYRHVPFQLLAQRLLESKARLWRSK